MVTKIHGMFTALVTPFKNDKIDESAFEKLIEHQIKSGIHGLVPCGSTGEFATLEDQEILQVIKLCTEITDKRIPVIAGIGTNNTAKTIALAQAVSGLGVDAVMAVVPYYNKPSQKGLYEHYKAIHDAINMLMADMAPFLLLQMLFLRKWYKFKIYANKVNITKR